MVNFFIIVKNYFEYLESEEIVQKPIVSTMHHFAKIGGFYELSKSIRFAKTFSIMESTYEFLNYNLNFNIYRL